MESNRCSFFIFVGCQQQVMTAMHFKQTVSVNQLCKLKWSINSICSTFTASVSTTKLTNSTDLSFYIFEIVSCIIHNGGLFEQYACVCTLNQSTSFNLPVNKPSIQISWNLQTGTTPNSQLTPFMQFSKTISWTFSISNTFCFNVIPGNKILKLVI